MYPINFIKNKSNPIKVYKKTEKTMQWRNNIERYGSLSIGLHWLMLLLLITVYACIELRGFFPQRQRSKRSPKNLALYVGPVGFCFGLVAVAVK